MCRNTLIALSTCLFIGCTSQKELPYRNTDNECVGTVERSYQVVWRSEGKEIESEKEEKCVPENYNPADEINKENKTKPPTNNKY